MAITTRPQATGAAPGRRRPTVSWDVHAVDRHDEPILRALDGTRPRAGTPAAPGTSGGPDR
ncbi:hypothetical protein [Georgenia sp. H159]|uniref:hypothetical protein n=1 Tax=Georgenia sp. H159 TaxID=3076115 RepID=UPI002D79663B|nr:hypothetical protein [Georgenia sp. H159]